MDTLLRLRTFAVRTAAVVVVIINGTSTADSYMGLRAWAISHGMIGAGSYLFPCFIDTFPLLAEIALFVGLLDGWSRRAKAIPWIVITAGLELSVGLQVGVIRTTDFWTKVTHGLPPVAAWLSLVVGVLMFELIMANRPEPEPVAVAREQEQEQEEPETNEDELRDVLPPTGPDFELAATAFADDLRRGRVPGLNRIRTTMHVGHNNAPKIQTHLKSLLDS